jgi:hypothetical protein
MSNQICSHIIVIDPRIRFETLFKSHSTLRKDLTINII